MADEHDLVVVARLRDELSRGLVGVRRELDRTTRAADALGVGSGKSARGLDTMERSGSRARRGLLDLHHQALHASRTLDSSFTTAVRRSATVLGLLTGGIATFGLKSESGFQQSRIAFEALLGSEERGLALFKQLQAINIKTPFELSEIAPATQLLLRYGVAADQVIPILESLLDAAALSGDPANNLQRLALATGQIVSQGRLLGTDARQLAEAGINAYDLFAQKLGITQEEARKLGEAGKLSADVFLQGLVNMEGPLAKLQGGAEKLSGTLSGQLSNLKDALRVRLADSAGPAVDELTQLIVPITDLVGTAVDQVGPPIFELVGVLTHGLMQVLPVAAPLLGTIVRGLGQLLRSTGPALEGLAPLGDRIGAALVDMFTELEPVMPDLVELFIALVGVLPDFIRLLSGLIRLSIPLVNLITRLLEFGAVSDVLAGLLIVLLGYSKVAGIAKFLYTFATALGFVGMTAEATGVQAQIAWGRLARLGAITAGGALAIPQLDEVTSGKSSFAQDAQFIGGAALVGAGIAGPYGAAVGGGLAAAYTGFAKLFGDPAVPAGTLAAHYAAGGGAPGLQITSGLRSYGLRSSGSGHLRGTAVDVAGPGLQSYIERVRGQGGWAVMEGAGTGGTHAHAQWGDPAVGAMGAGAAGGGWSRVLNINLAGYSGTPEQRRQLKATVKAAVRELEHEDVARSYDPVRGRR